MSDLERLRSLLVKMSSLEYERRHAARAELVRLGLENRQVLQSLTDDSDPAIQRCAGRILKILHENDILQEWRELLKDGPDVLIEEGAILIARAEYPYLSREELVEQLAGIAATLASRLPLDPHPLQTLEEINHLLFDEMGFHGNQDDYYEPENSFLNDVLDRRTGIPISLSVLYMAVSRRVGLTLSGVGMPMHFLVKFDAENDERFIDVFHNGRFLTREDCQELLNDMGGEYQPDFLFAIDAPEIYARMLRNLIGAYQQTRRPENSLICLNQILEIVPDSPAELFMRATIAGSLGETVTALADVKKLSDMPNSVIPSEQLSQLASRLIAQNN